jgi:hypothetical protein
MDYFSNKSVYSGKLKLQASNVGFDNEIDITTIFTVEDELHEGWNYYTLKEIFGDSYVLPKFNKYRLYNS